MTEFKPCAIPMAVGSFPYADKERALVAVVDHFPEIPIWPQLPAADPREQMYIQYYEGMPGIKFDADKDKLFASPVDDELIEEMSTVFEKVMEEDYDFFKISPDHARGFYYFLDEADRIKALSPKMVKGQVTGPVSFSLVVTDDDLKPILYDETYREIVTNVLKMKALWMAEKLKSICDCVLIFLDEPYLSSLGSSMVALSREEAVHMISELTTALAEKDVLSGVHCCGNTDWSVLFEAGCSVISMDAWEYGDNFLLFLDEVVDYINRGGILAWGIVPTSPAVDDVTPEILVSHLEKLFEKLKGKGLSIEKVLEQSLITPSCGMGNVELERTERILNLTRQVSEQLKAKYNV